LLLEGAVALGRERLLGMEGVEPGAPTATDHTVVPLDEPRECALVGELRMFRVPVVVGGGTPFLPPVTEVVPLDLVETRTFGSRVIYERYRQTRDELD
jgi:hypothetical protein